MNFQLPATSAAPPASGAFSFDTSAAPKPAFAFGANAGGGDADNNKSTTAGFSLGQQPAAAGTATTAPTVAATPNLSFGTAAPVSGPATTSAAAAAPTALRTMPAATAAASLVGLGGAVNSNTQPGGGGFANLSTATKTTDSSAVAHASQLTYNQLEEHINKWTLEFEEQEKIFTEQATQINAWDKILITNNHKIIELNDAVQKVKADQQLLEQELEFIATQHKELEESIIPLQKEFTHLPQVDVERSQTYLLVENLDTQLKQMSEDLKEIIDNLNESNKGQDNTDPIIQIGKILNAHMSSLQYIETSSTSICNKLDDISKVQDSHKRNAYRSAFLN